MKYFEAYEARRNLYKKVQPGTLWRAKDTDSLTVLVKSVDSKRGTINGLFLGTPMCGRDTIEWLLKYYELES